MAGHIASRDDARDRDDRADGEIEAAADEHECLSEGDMIKYVDWRSTLVRFAVP